MSSYDAIVIGAGHNGLVAGAYLAKAGLKTLLLGPYALLAACLAARKGTLADGYVFLGTAASACEEIYDYNFGRLAAWAARSPEKRATRKSSGTRLDHTASRSSSATPPSAPRSTALPLPRTPSLAR